MDEKLAGQIFPVFLLIFLKNPKDRSSFPDPFFMGFWPDIIAK